jgi:glycosyltransferase involved in cell wall biosynthesis
MGLKVAVDGRSLRTGQLRRGVSAYLDSLLTELRRPAAADRYEVVERGRLATAGGALTGRPRLDRMAGGCDVVWAPAPVPLATSRDVPLVLTVHDLTFEHREGELSGYERLFHRAARPRALARRATRVVAVSEHVRAELIEEWQLPPERVVTVRSGPGRPPPPRVGAAPPPGLPESYLLAVGAVEARKGIDLLQAAHRLARDQGLRAGLVLAGEGTEAHAGEGGVALGYVQEPQLDALYERALGVVCASREEGFGFTPLEALARGTPVIVSDLPPFRETLGEAALRVPPDDEAALATAMLRLEREPELGPRLVAAATEPLANLSWKRAAAEMREVFAAAARGRRR